MVCKNCFHVMLQRIQNLRAREYRAPLHDSGRLASSPHLGSVGTRKKKGKGERTRGHCHFWAEHTECSMPRGVGWGPRVAPPASVTTSKGECPWKEAQKYLGASSSYSQAQTGKADLRGNAVASKDWRSSSPDLWGRSRFPNTHEGGSPRITSTPNYPHLLSPITCLYLIKQVNPCRALAMLLRLAKMRMAR